jgi:N-acetylated-alpha-linked acidic dipeptidase
MSRVSQHDLPPQTGELYLKIRAALKIVLSCVFLLLFSARPHGHESAVLMGFSQESGARELQMEQRLKDELSPQKAEEHSRWITSRPHRAGTEGARITAEHIQQRLQEYGIPSEIVRYDAYLPAPVSVSVELVAPVAESLPTTEDPIHEDPFTKDALQHPGWNGYSPSGEATGDVVYVNYGSEDDLRLLQSMGVDLRGKIFLARYFGTGEGRKVRNAEHFGAAGVVLYTDPAEDGYRYGDVYPAGDWRPPGSIMRRSIISLPYEGDPLSPGWASISGAKRLKPEEVALPKIPVLPISYRSAERILNLIKGPVAPYEWQGQLPLPYKIGPGPAKLHIRTEMDNRDRPILNVIGKIVGKSEPEEWVILGNHHDAWIFGAGDPSSGTASLLELARGIGNLSQQGYRPRRTLIFAFWDAEEMLLGGSTEWVEQHADELLQKAVACINMDSSVFNTDRPLSVNAHPVLHQLFRDVSRSIRDPKTGLSLYEAWRDLQNRYRTTPSVDGWGDFFDPNRKLVEPWIFASPNDDAGPFFTYLALPASDMYFGADYGMYHSLYEYFHWMKSIVDPKFEYHIVMAQLQGLVSLRLANAEVVPLDYAEEARYWRQAYQSLVELAHKQPLQLEIALKAIDRWEEEAKGLTADASRVLASQQRTKRSEKKLTELNRRIYLLARDFYRKEGRPDNPYERNMLAGSSYDFEEVSGGTLPGIRFALDKGDVKAAQSEASFYLKAIRRRIANLQSLRREFRGIH